MKVDNTSDDRDFVKENDYMVRLILMLHQKPKSFSDIISRFLYNCQWEKLS